MKKYYLKPKYNDTTLESPSYAHTKLKQLENLSTKTYRKMFALDSRFSNKTDFPLVACAKST